MKKIAMIVATSLALSVSVEAMSTEKKPSGKCVVDEDMQYALSYLPNLSYIKEQLAANIISKLQSKKIKLSRAQEQAIREAIGKGKFSFEPGVEGHPITLSEETEECVYHISPQNSPIFRTPKPFS